MDVFSAFPEAIISNQWEIGQMVRDIGAKVFKNATLCDVIVEEGTYADIDRSPQPEGETSDILLYAKPEQLPTLVTAQLNNGYIWHDKLNDLYYTIRESSLGKNQDNGTAEHVEFLLRPTEVLA